MSEVPRSLKQWSINLEQILFLLQGYYFNFYAWVEKKKGKCGEGGVCSGGGGGGAANYEKNEITKTQEGKHASYLTSLSVRKYAAS